MLAITLFSFSFSSFSTQRALLICSSEFHLPLGIICACGPFHIVQDMLLVFRSPYIRDIWNFKLIWHWNLLQSAISTPQTSILCQIPSLYREYSETWWLKGNAGSYSHSSNEYLLGAYHVPSHGRDIKINKILIMCKGISIRKWRKIR